MTSEDLFFPTETSDYSLGTLGMYRLPPFSLWVDGSWLDRDGRRVTFWTDDDRERLRHVRRLTPQTPGVYIFAATSAFGRLRGFSDILYIGRGYGRYGLLGRIRDSHARETINWLKREGPPVLPRPGAELKIANYYFDHRDIRLGWMCDASGAEALRHEKKLLRDYELDHAEPPPFNTR